MSEKTHDCAYCGDVCMSADYDALAARLAEAERLLAKIHDAPLPHAIRYDVVCFLERATVSAPAVPKCERCGDTGWISGDPVAGISDEPCGCDEVDDPANSVSAAVVHSNPPDPMQVDRDVHRGSPAECLACHGSTVIATGTPGEWFACDCVPDGARVLQPMQYPAEQPECSVNTASPAHPLWTDNIFEGDPPAGPNWTDFLSECHRTGVFCNMRISAATPNLALTGKDSLVFANAIIDPPAPSARLRAATVTVAAGP